MKRYELEVLNGELKGKSFEIRQGGVKVGRSSASDVQIPDAEMSRSHCIVELNGDGELRVTDLASANGTKVNGADIGARSVELKPGDEIEVGDTKLKVTEAGARQRAQEPAREREKSRDKAPPIVIPRKDDPKREIKKKAGPKETVRQALWGATVGVLVLAMAVVLLMPSEVADGDGMERKEIVKPGERDLGGEETGEPFSFTYEKVEGDSSKILRMYAELKDNRTLRVELNEVGGKPRTVNKIKRGEDFEEEQVELLEEMFDAVDWDRMDKAYYGPESEPPVLNSYIVEFGRGRSGRRKLEIINMPEPEAFRVFRRKLENFLNTEFGLMAFELSEEELMAKARSMAETGRVRYEDRDADYGNLHESIKAYKEALAYFDTIDPKPPEYKEYRAAREESERELEKRYRDYNFEATKAIKQEDLAAAKEMLTIVMRLVGDRRDERYRQAETKLNGIEKRLRKGGRQ